MCRRISVTLLLLLCLGFGAGLAPTTAFAIGSVADEPRLTLTPNQAPCGTTIVARGVGFPVGHSVEIAISRPDQKPTDAPLPVATVADDGTFALDLMPCVAATGDADGTQYAISASVPNPDPLAPFDAYAQAIYTVGPVAQRPLPTLSISPTAGPCNGPAMISGANWFPGDSLSLTALAVGSHTGVGFADVTVGADGTFLLAVEMHRATLCSAQNTPALGTRYRIGAGPNLKGDSPRLDQASAEYAISAERLTERCFAETGYCVRGAFYERWEQHGVAGNGFPLSDEFEQRLEDEQVYRVQYFERVRMEHHPENAPPYDVLLGQFGRRIVATVPDAPTAPVAPLAGSDYFAETGHNVDARFFSYWLYNGGLEQFGFPLTEAFEQQLEDGQTYQVQYFERARFEYHPENGEQYQVLLGQFGRRILDEQGQRTLTIDPASGPCLGIVAVRGGGFAPNVVARFTIRRDRDGEITGGNSLAGGKPTGADGTYSSTIPLLGCGPDEPVGSTFTIMVAEYYPDRTPTNGPGASATFTVAAP